MNPKKLLTPPAWLIVLLSVLSATGLIWVFTQEKSESPIAYIVYVFAFYALTVLCIYLASVLPRQYRALRQRIYGNRFGNRYITDEVFRTGVSLNLSLGISLLYVLVNTVSFLLYRSRWFLVLACYYVILSVMRFLLVRYVRSKPIGTDLPGEWKRCLICAVILLSVNLVLSGAVLMILYQNKGYAYPGMLIYVMAAYTFYITTHAIIDMVKYRAMESPVMSTAKVVNLSAALVSMLALETAMLSRFGADMSAGDKGTLVAATGGGISVAVVVMSVYMIVRATREIRKDKKG